MIRGLHIAPDVISGGWDRQPWHDSVGIRRGRQRCDIREKGLAQCHLHPDLTAPILGPLIEKRQLPRPEQLRSRNIAVARRVIAGVLRPAIHDPGGWQHDLWRGLPFAVLENGETDSAPAKTR